MGRIFETRKHTMFARWDRMAKQFARVGKEITIAVKASGPNPEANPALRRAISNARAVNMPKDKVEAAIKRASGQGRGELRRGALRGIRTARHRGAGRDRDRQHDAHGVRHPHCLQQRRRQPRLDGSVAFQFRHMGVFRLDPEGIDAEVLELDLIDHGLEEMGESTGDKGEPVLVIRCAFADFGHLQKALEDRDITPISAGAEYIATTPIELPEAQAAEVLAMIDKLEQDDDVQQVFHNLA